MNTWWILLIGLAVLFLLAVANSLVGNALSTQRWLRRPLPQGDRVDVGGYRVYALCQGEGKPTVVLETAVNSLSLEWWPIQQELIKDANVLLYDRAGNGWSEKGPFPRTSQQVVKELRALLDRLQLEPPFLLVGQSQGGLYLQHFARLYPQEVAGLVLADPVSTNNDRFNQIQSPIHQRYGSIASKIANARRAVSASRLGLMRSTARRMRSGAQFDPYRDLPDWIQEAVLENFILPKAHLAAVSELESLDESIVQVRKAGAFPLVPFLVLHHDPLKYRQELENRGYPADTAQAVEEIWLELHQELAAQSPQGEMRIVPGSGHAIHLDQPQALVKGVRELLGNIRAGNKTL
jgi:pimeloyl-ACP methyl ester carboxylesterase